MGLLRAECPDIEPSNGAKNALVLSEEPDEFWRNERVTKDEPTGSSMLVSVESASLGM